MNSNNRSYETSWTWKKGVSMERTLRENRNQNQGRNQNQNSNQDIYQNKKIEFIENNIINNCLNNNLSPVSHFSQQTDSQSDYFQERPTLSCVRNNISSRINTGKMTFKRDNIRSENNEKLSTREHIIQRKVNPFLVDNDFKKDLEIQNEFLIPKNSNYEKEENLSL